MTETNAQVWNEYWENSESHDYVNYTPQLLNTLKANVNLSGCHALEIGVGTGGNSTRLASYGAQVVGLDFSALALNRTRRTAQQAGSQVLAVMADARFIPFAPESFDLIVHQGFLEHFRDPAPLVMEQLRVLRREGYLLVDVPQRFNLYTLYKRLLMRVGRWPYGGWEREFSYAELCNLLQVSGFCVIAAYGRGYFPRVLEMLHNMPNAELKVLKRRVVPNSWWEPYRRLWNRFEHSPFGFNTLQCIGVLARKI